MHEIIQLHRAARGESLGIAKIVTATVGETQPTQATKDEISRQKQSSYVVDMGWISWLLMVNSNYAQAGKN